MEVSEVSLDMRSISSWEGTFLFSGFTSKISQSRVRLQATSTFPHLALSEPSIELTLIISASKFVATEVVTYGDSMLSLKNIFSLILLDMTSVLLCLVHSSSVESNKDCDITEFQVNSGCKQI
ncbi:hypothetical protein GQX74_007857 [Glossina fuscipes]|nr:hypothetical protein GQX74_007857 [Glossina fuscipes]